MFGGSAEDLRRSAEVFNPNHSPQAVSAAAWLNERIGDPGDARRMVIEISAQALGELHQAVCLEDEEGRNEGVHSGTAIGAATVLGALGWPSIAEFIAFAKPGPLQSSSEAPASSQPQSNGASPLQYSQSPLVSQASRSPGEAEGRPLNLPLSSPVVSAASVPPLESASPEFSSRDSDSQVKEIQSLEARLAESEAENARLRVELRSYANHPASRARLKADGLLPRCADGCDFGPVLAPDKVCRDCGGSSK